jgi:hypothetical protein
MFTDDSEESFASSHEAGNKIVCFLFGLFFDTEDGYVTSKRRPIFDGMHCVIFHYDLLFFD